jgi:hypothetical protein
MNIEKQKRRISINKSEVEKLPFSPEAQTLYRDEKLPGFGVKVI